jgi:1-acyl-sn-glycerol-3-phosphate acyltransferase
MNAHNIPEEGPVIFTPNHQNALMDALAIIYSTCRQPVFMARADIFKKDKVKKILTFLKIIPVYRIRDGIESLSNNDESFELAFRVLKNNGSVGIMPEGNHGEQRRLRPLKKGVARLAIQAQELLGKEASIKIVPVGLDFSTYQGLRGSMVVNFGKPIEVSQFLTEYKENAARGLQSIRTQLVKGLNSVMINIDSDDFYETIYEAKELLAYHNRDNHESFCDKFEEDKILTDRLVNIAKQNPDELTLLKKKLIELNYASHKLKISPWTLSWNPPVKIYDWISDISRYLFFFPLFVLAGFFHIIPYLVSEFYSNKVKDKQFVSSMRFVFSFVCYLLWYLIVLIFPFSILLKVIFLITMPILGIMSFDYWDALKKGPVKLQYILLKLRNDPAFRKVQSLHNEIIEWLSLKNAKNEI